MNKSINEKYLWALTPEALKHIEDFERAGMDKDLAIAVLEQLLPADEIYELDEE
jgi:hypothetical protein